MKLHDDIASARGFTACIATSYNIDIAWTERLLVRQLRGRGVRNIVVLADRARLSDSLEAQIDLLQGAGHAYALVGLRSDVSFHPKLLLLTGPARARLYIGSGNLTSHGYGRNREVFARFDVEKNDTHVSSAFVTVSEYLARLCSENQDAVAPFVREAIAGAFRSAVFTRPIRNDPDEQVWGSPDALFDRLTEPPTVATRLRMMAPSFDDGRMAIELARRLRAVTFEVVTDLKTTNLTKAAADAILAAGGTLWVTEEDRPLHAKVLCAHGEDWKMSIIGSANVSSAAWRGHNAELVVAHRGALADKPTALLDGVNIRAFTPDDRDRLPTKVEIDAGPTGPAILSARWDGQSAITLSCAVPQLAGVRVQLKDEHAAAEFAGEPDDDGRTVHVATAGTFQRGKAVLVRVVDANGIPGGWVLVHDAESLAEHGRPESRAETALRDLLGDHSFDAEGASRLLEFMTRMWRERKQRGINGTESGPDKPRENPLAIVWVRGDVPVGADEPVDPKKPAQPSSYIPLPATLLRRLLFGHEIPNADGDDAPVEGLQDSDADGRDGDGSDGDAGDSGESGEDTETKLPEAARRSGVPPRATPSFAKAAADAFKEYLDDLSRTDELRPAARLVSDMQLLASAFHYVFRARGLPAMDFRRHMVVLLRELIGFRNKPLVQALRALATRAKPDAWSRVPIVQLLGLVSYNACLAHLELDPGEREASTVFHDGPVFWMRNVVREVPRAAIDEVLLSADRDGAAIVGGELHLGERWSHAVVDLPFASYLRQLIEDARALLALEEFIAAELATATTPYAEDAQVLGLGRDGSLAVGWIEIVEATTGGRLGMKTKQRQRVLLHDTAFLEVDAPPEHFRARMHSIADASKARLVAVDDVRARVVRATLDVRRGLDVLTAIR